MTYEQVIQLPTRYKSFTYAIYQDSDGKIYNVDLRTHQVLYVRDPKSMKFKLNDIVLVKSLGEYGQVIEVKQDEDWGNHRYDVEVFNDGVYNSVYRDEFELEGVDDQC